MARRRYRRYRRRHGKWSANLQRIRGSGTAQANTEFVDFYTIAQNNTATTSESITQLFSVKNIEVSAVLEGPAAIENVEYYIMFVPQGYILSNDLPVTHPEWIMAYKFIGTPIITTSNQGINSQAQPVKVRTRLARKLNSGDQVVFLIRGVNSDISNPLSVRWTGLVRWWTKAN